MRIDDATFAARSMANGAFVAMCEKMRSSATAGKKVSTVRQRAFNNTDIVCPRTISWLRLRAGLYAMPSQITITGKNSVRTKYMIPGTIKRRVQSIVKILRKILVSKKGMKNGPACMRTVLNDDRVRPDFACSKRFPMCSTHTVPHTIIKLNATYAKFKRIFISGR